MSRPVHIAPPTISTNLSLNPDSPCDSGDIGPLPAGTRLSIFWPGCDEAYDCVVKHALRADDGRGWRHACEYENGEYEHDLSTLDYDIVTSTSPWPGSEAEPTPRLFASLAGFGRPKGSPEPTKTKSPGSASPSRRVRRATPARAGKSAFARSPFNPVQAARIQRLRQTLQSAAEAARNGADRIRIRRVRQKRKPSQPSRSASRASSAAASPEVHAALSARAWEETQAVQIAKQEMREGGVTGDVAELKVGLAYRI